jgi:glycosyltransferase involved in cell wall biosynthesis
MSGPRREPLRVALVDPSGYSRPYDHELARALARRGHDVTLWTSRFQHGDAPAPAGYRLRETFYGLSGRTPRPARRAAKAVAHPFGLAGMAARLLRARPDVVHVQWVVMRPLERRFYRALRRARIPIVFTAHDPVPNVGGTRHARSAAATARGFPHVVVHTSHGERLLAEEIGLEPDRIHRIPHGPLGYLADLPAPADPPAASKDDAPLAVLPGLIRPYKGVDTALRAWPVVRAQLPHARLVIAGRPMMDLRDLHLPQPGVEVDARFLPDREFAALLRRADAVVLPYHRIDSSGTLFAALALGAPIVLTDVGGFRELHEELGVGAMVPAGDWAALAQALVDVLAHPAERERLAAASAAAADALGWDAIAEATEEVYRLAAAERSAGGSDSSREPAGASGSTIASK